MYWCNWSTKNWLVTIVNSKGPNDKASNDDTKQLCVYVCENRL